METKTKYSIGDIVKIIMPDHGEAVAQIDEIKIHTTKQGEHIEYYSNFCYEEKEDEYGDTYYELVGILESKEDINECQNPYIKCKVEIKEIND